MSGLKVLALLVAANIPLAALAADLGKISLHIDGLRNSDGVVRVVVFNSDHAYENSWTSAESACQTAVAPIKAMEADCTLESIPYGEYAIKVFHDEDNSDKFYTSSLGMPKVQYGFSNNARGLFGQGTKT